MSLLLKNAKVLIDRNFLDVEILIDGDKIADIGHNLKAEKQLDLANLTVLPGFIDTHTHGGGGFDVNLSSADELLEISKFFAKNGTTLWLASILTDTQSRTLECIENVKTTMKQNVGAKLFGIHLEGPFLAKEYKGAMPEHLLMDGDLSVFNQYKNAADGAIKYMTVSPEIDGVLDIIKDISADINVGIGHSGADYKTAMAAINNGATVATHTFNAMRSLHHHETGIVGACLVSDIWCEAVLDGLHLNPQTVKLLLKTKGYDKIIGITDSIMAAGLPDGDYKLGVNGVIVKGGDARLKIGDARAGSTLTMGKAIKNLVAFTDDSLENLTCIITENPAKALGIFDKRGSIATGKYADFTILNADLDVVMTISEGNIVYQK